MESKPPANGAPMWMLMERLDLGPNPLCDTKGSSGKASPGYVSKTRVVYTFAHLQ